MVLLACNRCDASNVDEMNYAKQIVPMWRSHYGKKIWVRGASLAVAYVVLFVTSGSWHVFLVGTPILPVRVSDCVIQRKTVCHEANLKQAQLARASLYRAKLIKANLSGSNLWHADLRNANLTGANLIGTALWYTNLRSASLINANLSGANLIAADLSGADLSGADLFGASLHDAKYDADTKWPYGFDPVLARAWLVGLEK